MMTKPSPKKYANKDYKKGLSESNCWWHETRRRQIPYIGITRTSTYAEVWFDYLTLDHRLDKVLDANEERIVEGLRSIFQKYAGPKSVFSVRCAKIPTFERVPVENADALAEEMFDFYCQVLGLGEFRDRTGLLA